MSPPTHTQQSLGGGRTQPGRTQPPLYLVSLENITKVMSGEFNFLRLPFVNAFLFYNWCFQIPICSSKLHKEVLHSIASSCQTQGKLLFYSDAGSVHTQMLLKHMSDLVTGWLSLQLAKQVTISAKQEQLPGNGDRDKADMVSEVLQVLPWHQERKGDVKAQLSHKAYEGRFTAPFASSITLCVRSPGSKEMNSVLMGIGHHCKTTQPWLMVKSQPHREFI